MTEPVFNSPAELRLAIREGRFRGFTNLLARDHVQGNLMIVPAAQAGDFERYCRLNQQALPLIGRSRPGECSMPAIAEALDIRTDVGSYMVFRDGVLCGNPQNILGQWREDLVTFVLGCSFSFERLLERAGVRLRHLEEGNVSAMYVTNRPTIPAGAFAGPLVVSMRALSPADVELASAVSARYPLFHGAPVHIGDPGALGIDLASPYGGHGLTRLKGDEIPVFWACGATAQLAATAAALPLCITHYKAHMVVTDLPIDGLSSWATVETSLQ
jgi:uncharacterized protein YcsI (UPF0317 family)